MSAAAFFETRFVIRPKVESAGDHWFGGEGDYGGANCGKCGHRLLLLMDVNCTDPVLRKASGGKFGTLGRLPLFVCAWCYCELSYRVDDERRVTIVQTRYGNEKPEPIYEGFPASFPRTPVALDSFVPAGLSKVIGKWDPDVDLQGKGLSKEERRLLEDYFGHPIWIPRFMYHHQLGGAALFESWYESAFNCPNKQCSRGLINKIMNRNRPMSFLAGLLNDPPGGLPFYEPLNAKTATEWEYGVSHYFQICDRCLTITTFAAGS